MIIRGKIFTTIELVVHATIRDIQEHFERAIRQGKALNATAIWVVHITIREQDESFIYPWPTETQSQYLRVLHIWHDIDFTKLKIYKSKEDFEEILLLKG